MIFTLFDDARAQEARLMCDFVRREYVLPAELERIDALLARGWAQGWHAAIRIPYAFGHALVGLPDSAQPLALDWYARTDTLCGADIDNWLATLHPKDVPAGLLAMRFAQNAAEHAEVIARIHEHIRAGDVYQINHTLRAYGRYYGAPAALYRALRARQPAPYAAYAYHPDDGHTLCLSPELFLQRDGEQLHTLPMKGTARAEGDIEAAKAALQNDGKNRAENAMIVDLLRNDLSRIARPFGVSVSDAFHVAQHGQVLQMTTRVNARLREGVTHAEILRAAFPCGSITGAPKRMAMHLIDRLEIDPRGLYTGAIGYLEPERFCLNVAIRTLILQDGCATFGVGAGITIESTAADEYREYQLKTAFLHAPPDVGLIETLRVSDGRAPQLAAHLARLAAGAQDLGIPFARGRVEHRIAQALQSAPHGNRRLKITLHPDGNCDVHTDALSELPSVPVKLLIHPHTLPERDALRCYKTTHRAFFDAAWQAAEAQGAFDSLIFNDSGALLEGGRSSVFICLDGQWHTPPLSLDILPGIARAHILADPARIGATQIRESRISRDMLVRAERVIVCNSLRGILAASLLEW